MLEGYIYNNIIYITTIAIIVIAIFYIKSRYLISTALGTYVIINDEGFKETLPKGKHFIWNINEKVFKGNHAPDLNYKTISSKSHALLNRRTGRINLKIQQLQCEEFLITTNELKEKKLIANVTFRLNRETLKYSLMYEKFGETLQARIEEAFRETISEYGDQNIGINKNEIINKVSIYLNKSEDTNNADKNEYNLVKMDSHRTPLGIEFVDIGFYIKSEAEIKYNNESIKAGETVNIRPMEDINPANLDSIRDQFLIPGWETSSLIENKESHYQRANEIMLSILELQSHQNTSRALINSGSLMILSSSEMGMKGNLLREPLRKEIQNLQKDKVK